MALCVVRSGNKTFCELGINTTHKRDLRAYLVTTISLRSRPRGPRAAMVFVSRGRAKGAEQAGGDIIEAEDNDNQPIVAKDNHKGAGENEPLSEWLANISQRDARGITIRGKLVDCIASSSKKRKRIENRGTALRCTRLLHKGLKSAEERWEKAIASVELQPPYLAEGCIVGAVRFDGPAALTEEDTQWLAGPVANRISDVYMLPTPVPHRGNFTPWRISKEAAAAIEAQFKEVLPPADTVRAAQLGLRPRRR